MATLMFNLFALLTVIAAVGTVLNRNAVNAAMCFMLCLVGVSGLFVMLEAYLLAFVLILVYAGAVAALFLFIIMLLNTAAKPRPFTKATLLSSTVAAALLAVGVLAFYKLPELATAAPAGESVGASLKGYAYQLFTTYLLPVQIVGFLLLIAMLGVIVLSKKFEATEAAKMIAASLNTYLVLSALLFAIGFFGVLLRKNTLIIFMGLELMLVASTLALVAFSRYNGTNDGNVFVFFILTVAAAEVAVGLAIIVALFRKRQTIEVDELNHLKN